jgi:hypothetical protein
VELKFCIYLSLRQALRELHVPQDVFGLIMIAILRNIDIPLSERHGAPNVG